MKLILQLCQPPDPQACAVPECCEPASAVLKCRVWDLVGVDRVQTLNAAPGVLGHVPENLVPRYGPTARLASFRVCRVHSHQLDLDSDWKGTLKTVDELRRQA